MIVINVEHVESTASSGCSGRQPTTRLSVSFAPNSIANISASSSTRSGRRAATMHWKSRLACWNFSLGTACNIRSYVSSRVVGSSFKTFRILDGMHRRSVSNWQNTHRNLSNAINDGHEVVNKGSHMPPARSDSTLTTSSLSSSLHLRMAGSV